MTRRVDLDGIVAGIAAGLTDADVARQVGCHPTTARRYRQRDDVVAELRAVRAERLQRNADRLGELVDLAVRRVADVLRDEGTPASVVVAALRAVVAAFGDAHDRADIETRLAALEAALAPRGPLRAVSP